MTWTFDRAAYRLSHPNLGSGAWECVATGAVVAGCVPLGAGSYTLGSPQYRDVSDGSDNDGNLYLHAEGPYFIPIAIDGDTSAGYGIHGGGSAAPQPLAAVQGLYPTEGCIRVHNTDLYHLALNVASGDTLEVV